MIAPFHVRQLQVTCLVDGVVVVKSYLHRNQEIFLLLFLNGHNSIDDYRLRHISVVSDLLSIVVGIIAFFFVSSPSTAADPAPSNF